MSQKIKSIEIPAGESGKSKRTVLINQTGETNLDERTFDYLVAHPEHDNDLPVGLLGTIRNKRKALSKAEGISAPKAEEKVEQKEKPSKKL